MTAATDPRRAEQARRRLLDGMATAIKDRGVQATTVADVVREAGTSRRTFYEHFADRTDCFLAVLADFDNRIAARIAAAVDGDAPWREQIRLAITTWIRATADEPELALASIRDLAAVPGHRAFRKAEDAQFLALIRSLMSAEVLAREGLPEPADATVTILIGGLRDLVANALEDGAALETLVEPAIAAAAALLGPHAAPDRSP